MKRAVKQILIVLIITATLALGGCAKQGNTAKVKKHKFQVVSLDKVSGSISEGWRITLTVANNTVSNMRVTDASAFVHYNGRKICRLILDGEVLLPRRRCSQVEVPLRVTLSNPLTAFSLLNRVRKGDFSGITIDYSVTIKAHASHRSFERKNVSLEELAQQFNLGLKK